MDVGAVCERVREVASVRADTAADRAALEGGLRSVAVVRSWLASAEADLARRLARVASFPEQAIAEAGRGSQGEASRVLERSGTLGAVPALADALDDGSVTPGHVDAVTKVAKGLEGPQRDKLLERADRLVGIARHGSVNDFRKRLEREAESLRADDGSARFERQKRAARLRRWTDADGMWCLQGRFDPLTGVRLNARLSAEIEAAFAESVPEGCPTDPQAKSEFLAACALARIVEGNGAAPRAGRPEFVVVIEADVERAEPGTHRQNDEPGDGKASHSSDTGRGRAERDCGEPAHTDRGNREGLDTGASGRMSNASSNTGGEPGHNGETDGVGEPGHTDRESRGGSDTDASGSGRSHVGDEPGHHDEPGRGGVAGDGGPDFSDISARPQQPWVDWGLPVEIPWSVLIELFGDSDVYPVVVRNGVVLYAPGELNLGRSTRLANRAQRRALRALYATCGIPGCDTRFERCKMHHVRWWRHGGRTDLENLLPLCVHHHTQVHHNGWVLTLGPGRMLSLRFPDGTVRNTGPPGRRAA